MVFSIFSLLFRYLHRNVDLEQIEELAFYGVIHGPTHLWVTEVQNLQEDNESLKIKKMVLLKKIVSLLFCLYIKWKRERLSESFAAQRINLYSLFVIPESFQIPKYTLCPQ